jgi:hypothetical protein
LTESRSTVALYSAGEGTDFQSTPQAAPAAAISTQHTTVFIFLLAASEDSMPVF